MTRPLSPRFVAIVTLMGVALGMAGTLAVMKYRAHGVAGGGAQEAKLQTRYHCPMHPAIVSDKPGKCPICHMDLTRVEDEGEGDHQQPASLHPSLGEKQQLIGVATSVAEKRTLSEELRATGRVAYDPDLFAAAEEYRHALATRNQMSAGAFDSLKQQAEALVKSSRTKLKLMGLGEVQIRALAEGQKAPMSLLLPKGEVWVYAEVFEDEMAGVRTGQKVEVSAASVPGKTFPGRVASVSSIVNSPTRTVRVRAQVPDPQGLLRPDTFVNVRITLEYGERISVPEDAVLHSGRQEFVFVMKDEGRFEPRAVTLGVKASGAYEIVSGLQEGEKVVSAANFLIDSESRLRTAIQQMGGSAAK